MYLLTTNNIMLSHLLVSFINSHQAEAIYIIYYTLWDE